MKLLRVGPVGQERPAVLDGAGNLREISEAEIDGAFFASGGVARVREALERDELPVLDGEGLRIGAPIARPGKIVCIGLNYRDHAEETNAAIPAEPIIFMKAPNTIVGPYDEVLIPRDSVKTDWEVELAVVIGQTVRYAESHEEALAAVAGYAISNDVSEREFQLERGGSGTRASPARPSTRSAPGWSPPTRSPTRRTSVSGSGWTACRTRTETPRT